MEDEPEPNPTCKKGVSKRAQVTCQLEIRTHISLIMQAHFQLLQLAADVACMSCYFSACAPIFLKLADRAKVQAGMVIDAVLKQGGTVELSAIPTPCPNLAFDSDIGEQTLAAALEACIQIESSKNLQRLVETAKASPSFRRTAEDIWIESENTQDQLTRVLSTISTTKNKVEAITYTLTHIK